MSATRLFSEALVAIDGSKFKAVNNRDRNFTSAKLQRRMQAIESSINRYLTAIADRGYFKSEEILASHEAGITAIVPKSVTSGATAAGRFG